jgi:hypothetical protein
MAYWYGVESEFWSPARCAEYCGACITIAPKLKIEYR